LGNMVDIFAFLLGYGKGTTIRQELQEIMLKTLDLHAILYWGRLA